MVFTSVAFVLFFAVAVLVNYLLPVTCRWVWLLLASIFFYAYANPPYILVAAAIIIVTWYAAKVIERSTSATRRKQAYLFAIAANIGILVFFKYTNFFTNITFNAINFFRFHTGNNQPVANNLLINILAPLGISYITFQAIGYLIEIKRGNQAAENNLGHLATFLLFFPKIIAGPVERAHHFLPQIKTAQKFDYDNVSEGLKLALWGAFKKLVIADRLSLYVSAVLDNNTQHSSITLAIAVVFYAFQMYSDFSGYTDMARGFAKIIGYNLMPNFNRPLLARSVTDFWRKWHISLSTWFADYFYTPIAIAKRDWGNMGVVYAFFVTFITLGFWHGANWTFIVFGALQGLALTIEFFTRKARKNLRKKIPVFLNNFCGIAITFLYFVFSLIFFRAKSVSDAFTTLHRMATAKGPVFIENPSVILFSVLGIAFMMMVEIREEFFKDAFVFSRNRFWLVRNAWYCLLLLIILIAGVFDGGEFIYFKF